MNLTFFVLFSAVYAMTNAGLIPIGQTQSVAVTGTLLCNDEPYGKVKVKLYDEDGKF